LENFEGSLPAVLKYINELEKTEVETKPKPYPIIEETLTHEDDPQLPYWKIIRNSKNSKR